MSTLASPSRRSGFSLIEVAIALAIFVFGALAIVQIFPPALGVIRNNENRATATQMGETILARSAGKSASVPDAIYDGTATTWNDLAMAVVGTPSQNKSLPSSPLANDFNNSALNHFKYINGERHIVRAGIDNGASTPFVMLNRPYTGSVNAYSEGVIQGVQIGRDGKLDFTYATTSDGSPFTPAVEPTYYVSYRWNDGGKVNGVIDEPLKLLGTGTGDDRKVAQGLIDSTNRILAGAVAVRYRVNLYSISEISDNAIRGYLKLPSGALVGQQLSFDYLASDWRNLVDENGIDKNGLTSLLIKDLNPGIAPVGLLTFYDTSISPALQVKKPTPPTDKKGVTTYTDAIGQSAPRARTVYQGIDGWAQQLSVAAKSYIPFYTNFPVAQATDPRLTSLPREQWREYYWNGTSNILYFRASEAGKAIAVSFLDSTTGKVVNGAIITIDDDLTALPGAFSAGQVSTTVVTNLSGDPANVGAILSVQGLSIQARTAWQNGDRYNQVIVPGYRTLMP